MSSGYDAASIEVLSGLDPVRKRPGMYTDTSRPNHLAAEVIDNAVDEAIAGFADQISVTLHSDGAITVVDNGRGMPVDLHPELGLPGVEVVLSTLHAGGKFSAKSYRFSGGLHGVGVSVVNALSARLDVWVRRNGQQHHIAFEHGDKVSELTVLGTVAKRSTGTTLKFIPDPKYFDSPKFALPKLRHLLRAKSVLCAGLTVAWHDESTGETEQWHYQGGLGEYLVDQLGAVDAIPASPFVGSMESAHEAVDWALVWVDPALAADDYVAESYVNLVPTPGGGTHVNGLRMGLTDAVREYCEIRNLLPRGVKLAPEDVWANVCYVLSLKLSEPQFSGQTKERLASRESSVFVSGVVKDALSLWLNQHTETGDQIAQFALNNALRRAKHSKKVKRRKAVSGPPLPGKLADCTTQDLQRTELFLVEGDSAGGSAKQARDREFQAIMPLRGKILNTWEVASEEVLASQEVHDISVAIGLEPGSSDLSQLRYGKICVLADADSDGQHIASLLCALFVRHFQTLVTAGHVYMALPPLFRIDLGKEVYYASDEAERQGLLDRLAAEGKRQTPRITRFKGLGEMNPLQLRESTMAPETRRLLQLTLTSGDGAASIFDMLLARKRAADRRRWLETNGDLAEV